MHFHVWQFRQFTFGWDDEFVIIEINLIYAVSSLYFGMLNWFRAHDGQSCKEGVNVRRAKALHVDLRQISVQITSKVVIITQIFGSVRCGKRRENTGMDM